MERKLPNLMKSLYTAPTANASRNEEKRTPPPEEGELGKDVTLIQYQTENSNQRGEARKEIQDLHVGKKETKVSLFSGGMIVCLKNPKKWTTKPSRTHEELSKVFGYQSNTDTSILLY